MELMAVISGLSTLDEPCEITVYSDSQYIIHAFTKGWLNSWRRNGWTRSGGELANKDLWQTLYLLAQKHQVTWTWVKGHAGNQYNELCDRMATQAAQTFAEKGAMAQGDFQEDIQSIEPVPCDDADEPDQISLSDISTSALPDDTQSQMSKAEMEVIGLRSELDAANVMVQSALLVLDMSLVHGNQARFEMDYPCGGCPWCSFCEEQMPEEGKFSCARAYVSYHLAKLEAKKSV